MIRSTMFGQKMWLYNPDGPRLISISPIDEACFYNCIVCPFSQDEVKEKYKDRVEMDFRTLRRIIEAVPNSPAYSFDISAFGETLAFGEIVEFVRTMKIERPKVPVTISTNGVLLRPGLMVDLINAGLDRLQISLFTHEPVSYRWITGTATRPEWIWNNVEMAMSVKEEMESWSAATPGPEIQVFVLGIKEFEEEFTPFLSRWGKIADRAFVRPVYNACMELPVTPIHEVPEKRYPCIMPRYAASVSASGDVGKCYFHSFYREGIVGNVNERPLLEIWQDEEMDAFRWMHAYGWWDDDDDLCAKCDLWSAYTNVWDWDGEAFYCKKRLGDLFRMAPPWRGG